MYRGNVYKNRLLKSRLSLLTSKERTVQSWILSKAAAISLFIILILSGNHTILAQEADSTQAEALLQKGRAMLKKRKYNSALEYLNQSLALYEGMNKVEKIQQVLNTIGGTYINQNQTIP